MNNERPHLITSTLYSIDSKTSNYGLNSKSSSSPCLCCSSVSLCVPSSCSIPFHRGLRLCVPECWSRHAMKKSFVDSDQPRRGAATTSLAALRRFCSLRHQMTAKPHTANNNRMPHTRMLTLHHDQPLVEVGLAARGVNVPFPWKLPSTHSTIW